MNRLHPSMLATALLVTACGGGGDSFNQNQQPTSASLKIDANNGSAAAKLSYEAAIASGDMASLGGVPGLTASAPGGSAIAQRLAGPDNLVTRVVSQIPFGPDTFPCATGMGTYTVSGDLANPLTLSVGDSFRVVFELCDDGTGEVVDGTVDMVVGDFSGDVLSGLYLLSMDVTVDNLQVTTASDTITGSGDASVTLDTLLAPYIEAGVSGTRLTQDSNASSETMRNYSSSQTFDGNLDPTEYTMDASGTLESSQLTGSIDYSTESTFVGADTNYPHTGTLLVEGDSSTARLIAESATNVRIEIDTNGDGTVDTTINMTWDELTSL